MYPIARQDGLFDQNLKKMVMATTAAK